MYVCTYVCMYVCMYLYVCNYCTDVKNVEEHLEHCTSFKTRPQTLTQDQQQAAFFIPEGPASTRSAVAPTLDTPWSNNSIGHKAHEPL